VRPGLFRFLVQQASDARLWQIVLQKSKTAAVQIFGENLKRKEVNDSHSLSRATEVAHQFGARRWDPSDHYTNNAPAARGIFDHLCKTTFATVSAPNRHRSRHRRRPFLGVKPTWSSRRPMSPFDRKTDARSFAARRKGSNGDWNCQQLWQELCCCRTDL